MEGGGGGGGVGRRFKICTDFTVFIENWSVVCSFMRKDEY